MANIKKGDNGVILGFIVKDSGELVDIRGTTVVVTFKTSKRTFTKSATITDGINGECEVTLLAADLTESGIYTIEGEITFTSGNKFTSDARKFFVGERI